MSLTKKIAYKCIIITKVYGYFFSLPEKGRLASLLHMIKSKNLFSESLSVGPITYGLFYFLTPSALLDLAGGEVLQAVRHCRR